MNEIEGIEGIDKIEGIEGIDKIEGIEGIDKIEGVEGIDKIEKIGGINLLMIENQSLSISINLRFQSSQSKLFCIVNKFKLQDPLNW